jgi:hypothetical protein
MPAVDVICINHNIEYGVMYFQIKATLSGREDVYGLKYFSYDENYVCTGSKRFGYNCHIIKANDYTNRDLLIGYICIEYKMRDSNNIIINIQKSFLLLPNTNFFPTIQQNDLTFYSYKANPHKTIITFDTNTGMIYKIRFSERYKNIPIININIYYKADKLHDALPPPPMIGQLVPAAAPSAQPAADAAAQQKYLIMKMKYLNLKKQIN